MGPKTQKPGGYPTNSRILYGVLVGAATMGFRYFGVYDTGVCFALLTVNSISGWLDRTETRLYRLLGWKEDAE